MPSLSYRGLILAGVFSCAAALPLWAQTAVVRQHFEAALHDQQAGLLDAAADEYQAVVRLSPQLAEAYANLGLVDYARSRFQESAQALTRAAELKPGLNGVDLWLGVDWIKLGQPKRAVPLLREAVRRNPSDQQAQRWLGTALWNSGDTFAALDQLAKTSAKYPSDADTCFALGEAYRKAANHQVETLLASASGTPLLHQVYGDIYKDQHSWLRAAEHYRQASVEDPHWKGAHLGLAEVDLAQDKIAEAGQELHIELQIDPGSAGATVLLAEFKLLRGDVPGALRGFHEAIQRSPYEASAALGLAPGLSEIAATPLQTGEARKEHLDSIYSELQKSPKSAARELALAALDQKLGLSEFSADFAEYERALGNAPLASEAYARAVDAAGRGRLRQAESILRGRVEVRPEDQRARYMLARVLKALSFQTLNRLIEMAPGSIRVHQLLGQTYEDRDDDGKALDEYRTVEKMNPSLPGIHFEVGSLLWNFGDRTGALRELQEELKLNPSHAEANGEIGSILVIENEPEKAIPYLETALRIDPGLLLVHQQLGKAYMLQQNYPRAERELQIAAQSDLDGSAHYQLAMVYRKLGKPKEASREFEVCAKIRAERFEKEQKSDPAIRRP